MLRNLSNYFQLLWIIFCNQLKWERLELLDKLWEQSLNEIQFIRPHEGWDTKKSEWRISNIHHIIVGVTGSCFDFLLLFICSFELIIWWQKMSPTCLSWHHAVFIDHEITAYILVHSFFFSLSNNNYMNSKISQSLGQSCLLNAGHWTWLLLNTLQAVASSEISIRLDCFERSWLFEIRFFSIRSRKYMACVSYLFFVQSRIFQFHTQKSSTKRMTDALFCTYLS